MARSVMNNRFAQVPQAQMPRSSFDRSSGYKTTFDAGKLIPFFVDEALPGDTFNLTTTGFLRMATPIFPVMDNIFMDIHYFAVPNRLVWDNWQKMMGEQENPNDSTDYLVPQIQTDSEGWLEGSTGDYMGLPTGKQISSNGLFHRALALIWNEWYRDQNLQVSQPVNKDDGPDDAPISFFQAPFPRNKRHDYFTSALPWPQKGPAVNLPLGEWANVLRGDTGAETTLNPVFEESGNTINRGSFVMQAGSGTEVHWDGTGGQDFTLDWTFPRLRADLANATSATVNELRSAFQIQKMYERDARSGTRYTEVIRAHFGVTSPDMRLQRPEYLGGGTAPVNINPVMSTAETDPSGTNEGRNLGSLAAFGTSSPRAGFTKSFTEHCMIIGFISARADLTYQQTKNRMWSRMDRFDFYWPSLAFLGEQEVLNQEIYYQNSPGEDAEQDQGIFGYQERFAEYRYKPSLITGKFRSDAEGSLDAWHLSQDFDSLPALTGLWVAENPPIDRVIAVPSEPHFIGDFYHKLTCARPMPLYGVPGNIDRF